ncbi:MAG: zinc-binding alcohol dehydrogenase family protein, partial [Candidatus Acidiferrales bacterium]
MNAAVVHALDAPPRYGSFAEPVAGDGEAIVTVSAVGLHQIVKSLASGKHYGSTGTLLFIPGVDGVGRLEDGKRVYFGFSRSPFGTFAERSVTTRTMCFPVPEALDDVTVAAMMNPAMSSWAALTVRAQFAAGESVLILGATGVAGRLAIQIAKRLGARRIVAAGRNARALEEGKSLGADAVISLEQGREELVAAIRREFSENKIDVVLDYLWGGPAETLLEAISQKGLQHEAT